MTSKTAITIGRISLTVAFLALIGAWITQATGNTLMGMSQAHLFSDATVLALIGIGMFLDGVVHLKMNQ